MSFINRPKYGNKKVIIDGVKFDSKLELFCFNLLKSMNIEFEFQKQIVLFDKFKYNGKSIRQLTIVVDFVVNHNGSVIYIDSKGFPTETSKIKYKLLKMSLKDTDNTDVVWLKNKKEVTEYINKIK